MKKIVTLILSTLVITASHAVPARPGWQIKSQPDGTTIEVQLLGNEFHHYWINRQGQVVKPDQNGYWQVFGEQAIRQQGSKAKKQKAISHRKLAKTPAIGSPKGVVILVNFKDKSFQPENTLSAINDMMNGDNYTYDGATGSVRKYFSDQSAGQYTPKFDVIGPVTLAHNMSHYGGNDSEGNDQLASDMIIEACSIANALHNVDFTKYDNDEDGYVDFVYVLYAGMGEADGGEPNTIWPHAWNMESAEYFNRCSYNASERIFDGKTVENYACSAELAKMMKDQVVLDTIRTGIGTIAHEFSHVIGLYDLYDTDFGQNYDENMTPGPWHILDDGSYNNNGKTPPGYTLYDKYYLGWVTPENPGKTLQALTLKAEEGYQIANSDTLVSATSLHTVYYIENRQNEGWDTHIPGHGLLIWKIMYNPMAWENNGINRTDGSIRYALLSAAGKTTDIGTAADAFPGINNITVWTGPNGKSLTDIQENNGMITLNYTGEGDDKPYEPEKIHVEGFQYLNALYYDNEGLKYYYFDLYKDEDTTTGEKIYPVISFTVMAKNKTAINGTYDILRGDYWRSSADVVDIDDTQAASVTLQHVNEQGDYSIKGSFMGIDGIHYSFDDTVHVTAKDSDNDYDEIILNESTTPSGIQNITDKTSTAHKILRHGQILIIASENIYSVDGRKIE